MSIAQIAKLVTKVAKSPMGKLGMAAVAGGAIASIFNSCKKDDELDCGCVPTDTYGYIFNRFRHQLEENDEYGYMAFKQWYEDNFEGEYIEGCCGGLKPYYPEEWEQKCQAWIDNYLAGNDDCEGE